MKRCLCHALDPRAFPLINQKVSIFQSNKDGTLGLVLQNKVSASTKESEYKSMIAFTSKDILATKCQCHAGGKNEERVVCVHNLPLIYQLVMLLDHGLVEHIMIELCSRWNTDIEQCIMNDSFIFATNMVYLQNWIRKICKILDK